jgi:hypothetical protein
MAYDKNKLKAHEIKMELAETELKNEFRNLGKAAGYSPEELSQMISEGQHLDPSSYGHAPGSTADTKLRAKLQILGADRGTYSDTANWDTSFKEDVAAPKPKGLQVTDAKGNTHQFADISELENSIKKGKIEFKGASLVDLDNPGSPIVKLEEHPGLGQATYESPKRPNTLGEAVESAGGDKAKAGKYSKLKLAGPGESRVGTFVRNLALQPAATIEAAMTGEFSKADEAKWLANEKAQKLGLPDVPFPEVTARPRSAMNGLQSYMEDGANFGAKAAPYVAGKAASGLRNFAAGRAIGGVRGMFQGEDDGSWYTTDALQGIYGYGRELSETLGQKKGFMPGATKLGLDTLNGLIGSPLTAREREHSQAGAKNLMTLENKRLSAKDFHRTSQDIFAAIGEADPSRKGVANAGTPSINEHIIPLIDPEDDFDGGDLGKTNRSEGAKIDMWTNQFGKDAKAMYSDFDELVNNGKGKLGDAGAYAQSAIASLTRGKSKFKPDKDKLIPLDGPADGDDYYLVNSKSGWQAIKVNPQTGAISSRGKELGKAEEEFKSADEAYKAKSSTWDRLGLGPAPK